VLVETKILDDFTPWSIYVVAIFVVLAFLASVLFLTRTLTRPPQKHTAFRTSRHPALTPIILCIVTAATGGYLLTMMFFRFHAIEFDRDRIALIYFWPEPPQTIAKADLVGARLVRGARHCGYMEIATQEKTYSSVSFRRCTVAEDILKELGPVGR